MSKSDPIALYAPLAVGAAAVVAHIFFSKEKGGDGGGDGGGEAAFETFSAEELHDFSKRVFMHFGIPESDATTAADVLSAADLRGIDSHGVARLHAYFELLEAGAINPRPDVRVIRSRRSVCTMDGDNGLGLVVGPKANLKALELAREFGSGWVAVCNTNHYGIAGYYSVEAAKRGCIGVSMTNTTKLVAPLWGADRMLGTNPISVAIPAGKHPPVVVDMATSACAYGKIEIAERLGKSVVSGWAIDKHGKDTTDPTAMKDAGALLPLGSTRDLGGHKGYCLGAWVDVMTAVLSGANWGPYAPPFTLRGGVNANLGQKKVGKGIGHFFGAWDVAGFRSPDEFEGQMEEWVDTFHATRPTDPDRPVLVPGDPEHKAERIRATKGIPLARAVVNDLKDIQDKTGVLLKPK